VQRVRDRPACPRIDVLDEDPRLHTVEDAPSRAAGDGQL
jgi:hypothetical protein